MREDPGVDVFFFVAIVFVFLGALAGAYRRGADDPNWELRWRALDPGYRNWLAAMSTSRSWMSTLEDPEEIDLVKGFARQESRRIGYVDLAALALLALFGALALAGIVAIGIVTFAFAIYGLGRAVAEFLRHQQLRRRLPLRSDSEEAPPRQGTAAAA